MGTLLTLNRCLHAEFGTFSHICGRPSTWQYFTDKGTRITNCDEHRHPQSVRIVEDLTAEGIQFVFPGVEKTQPTGKKQMELF